MPEWRSLGISLKDPVLRRSTAIVRLLAALEIRSLRILWVARIRICGSRFLASALLTKAQP